MPLGDVSFLASLLKLRDDYEATPGASAPLLAQWDQVRDDFAVGRPTDEDIQIVRQMFRRVIHDNPSTRVDPSIFRVARWFGAADHRVEQRRGDTFSDLGLDPLHLGVLLLVSGWTPEITPLTNGVDRYLRLPPELRTHFTDQLYLLDEIAATVTSLKPEQITPEFREQLKGKKVYHDLFRFLTEAYVDLWGLLSEHGDHWALLYNEIQNSLWEEEAPVRVYWADLNMTTINEQDADGTHGDDFLAIVGGQLNSRFGEPNSVRNIQRTSFQFTARSPGTVSTRMNDFTTRVSHGLSSNPLANADVVAGFEPEAVVSEREISRDNLYQYALQKDEDIDAFAAVINFGDRFDPAELRSRGIDSARRQLKGISPDFKGIRKSGNPVLIDTLNALIIKAIYEMNGVLAAQNRFFEKTKPHPEDRLLTVEGHPEPFTVFKEIDLPKVGSPLYQVWESYRQRKAGFVAPGQYFPSRHGVAPEAAPSFNRGIEDLPLLQIKNADRLHPRALEFLRLAPRLGRIKGEMSHRREGSPGGANQQFLDRMREVAHLPSDAPPTVVAAALSHWQEAALGLSTTYREIHTLAVTDLRYAWAPKHHQIFGVPRYDPQMGVERLFPVQAHFLGQEVALLGYEYLAALEYDSWSAYQAAYPSLATLDDAGFSHVQDAFFIQAHLLRLPAPLLSAIGGDHKLMAVSDPRVMVTGQGAIATSFAGSPFPDLHKVEMQEMVFTATDEAMVRFAPEDLAVKLMIDLHLNVQVTLRHSGVVSNQFSVILPQKDVRGRNILPSHVVMALSNQGMIVPPPVSLPIKNIQRLPMSVHQDAKESVAQLSPSDPHWYYGTQPGILYVPFNKTFTVSVATTDFPVVRRAENLLEMTAAERRVNQALADVKKAKWPHKGGQVFVASPSVSRTANRHRFHASPEVIRWIDRNPGHKQEFLRLTHAGASQRTMSRFLSHARAGMRGAHVPVGRGGPRGIAEITTLGTNAVALLDTSAMVLVR